MGIRFFFCPNLSAKGRATHFVVLGTDLLGVKLNDVAMRNEASCRRGREAGIQGAEVFSTAYKE